MSPFHRRLAVAAALATTAPSYVARVHAADPLDQRPASVGTNTVQPSDASAMANFKARTGLDVGQDDQGRVVVRNVTPGSDGANAGIKVGDILTGLDGRSVKTVDSFQRFLSDHASQAAFFATFDRGGKALEMPLGRKATLLGMTLFPDKSDRPVVRRIEPNSAADRAGVKVGDLVSG